MWDAANNILLSAIFINLADHRIIINRIGLAKEAEFSVFIHMNVYPFKWEYAISNHLQLIE